MNDDDYTYWGETEWRHEDIDGKPVKCDWQGEHEVVRGDGFLRVCTSDTGLQQIEIVQDRPTTISDMREELILRIPVCHFHLLRQSPNGRQFFFGTPEVPPAAE
jgi:hypothetical protein